MHSAKVKKMRLLLMKIDLAKKCDNGLGFSSFGFTSDWAFC